MVTLGADPVPHRGPRREPAALQAPLTAARIKVVLVLEAEQRDSARWCDSARSGERESDPMDDDLHLCIVAAWIAALGGRNPLAVPVTTLLPAILAAVPDASEDAVADTLEWAAELARVEAQAVRRIGWQRWNLR